MSSKRFNKLPKKTSELPAAGIENLLSTIKKNCSGKITWFKYEWYWTSGENNCGYCEINGYRSFRLKDYYE